MGITRLAQCLRALNSLDEFKDRKSDVSHKIQGNRVYMDFVSIVYKTQLTVTNELNYLLFSLILINENLLNTKEYTSPKLLSIITRYSDVVPDAQTLIGLLTNLNKVKSNANANDASHTEIKTIINDDFIARFESSVREKDVSSNYVYQNVVNFIVDMLINKLIDVEYVLISFDGIPSFGKIQEQRQRRYMRYAYVEFQKLISTATTTIDKTTDNSIISARGLYDQNRFHVDIKSAIDYVYSKYHSGDLQKDITDMTNVIVEVIDRDYGEGEKILMDKLLKDFQIYHNDKSYVFYSPDGDSVVLCLNVFIKTKAANLNVVKSYHLEPTNQHNEASQYVNISTLYTNIVNVVQKNTNDEYSPIDSDAICCDFILMMNFFGNDFIHNIPTMSISTTFLDMMYIYAKFIKINGFLTFINDKINNKINGKVNINYRALMDFIQMLSEYENMMILDTYMADTEEKQKIIRYFGDVFPCRYMLDYRDKITETKRDLGQKITSNTNITNITSIANFIKTAIDSLNTITTITSKRYGDIWLKMEVKNIEEYATKIKKSPNILQSNYPKFLYSLRPRRRRSEQAIREDIDKIEENLIKHGTPIDLNTVNNSSDKSIKNFAFEYSNIRAMIPHPQMPTTDQDIDLYTLEWKSGRWMHVLNSYSFEIGYDWRKGTIKKIGPEMKRYQYDVLGLNNSQLKKMVIDYMKTLSWMTDYYMNTDDESTSTKISTWSFNYDRSPFISHIANYLQTISDDDLKRIMKDFYKKSLVPTQKYLKTDRHRFYIYPQDTQTIAQISDSFKIYFPDMIKNIKMTIDQFKLETLTQPQSQNQSQNQPQNQSQNRQFNRQTINARDTPVRKDDRFFDCRMCPYFSKCIFRSKHITFKELIGLNVNDLATDTNTNMNANTNTTRHSQSHSQSHSNRDRRIGGTNTNTNNINNKRKYHDYNYDYNHDINITSNDKIPFALRSMYMNMNMNVQQNNNLRQNLYEPTNQQQYFNQYSNQYSNQHSNQHSTQHMYRHQTHSNCQIGGYNQTYTPPYQQYPNNYNH